MSLILLFAGAKSGVIPPVVKIDTHDGVWDEKAWKKLQEKLRKQREKLAAQDDKRKYELRKELVRLYRGLPEERIEQAKIEAKVEVTDAKKADDVFPVLETLSRNLDSLQRGLIEEYKGILAREALRQEADEEDEFETIITAIL